MIDQENICTKSIINIFSRGYRSLEDKPEGNGTFEAICFAKVAHPLR